MRRLAGILAAVALTAIAGAGLILWKYDTASACAAAETALRDETPAILAEMARLDPRLAALAPGSGPEPATALGARLRERLDARVAERLDAAMAEAAQERLADRTAVDCLGLVAYREIAPEHFRRTAAERGLAKLEARLGG